MLMWSLVSAPMMMLSRASDGAQGALPQLHSGSLFRWRHCLAMHGLLWMATATSEVELPACLLALCPLYHLQLEARKVFLRSAGSVAFSEVAIQILGRIGHCTATPTLPHLRVQARLLQLYCVSAYCKRRRSAQSAKAHPETLHETVFRCP